MLTKVRTVLYHAFEGSVANNAGLGVLACYAWTVLILVIEASTLLFTGSFGKLYTLCPWLVGASVLFLVTGYVFNRPALREKR